MKKLQQNDILRVEINEADEIDVWGHWWGNRRQLMEIGARPLLYFPRGPEYVVLPKMPARDDNALVPWIRESNRYAKGIAHAG